MLEWLKVAAGPFVMQQTKGLSCIVIEKVCVGGRWGASPGPETASES